jgi:hypothetical protein
MILTCRIIHHPCRQFPDKLDTIITLPSLSAAGTEKACIHTSRQSLVVEGCRRCEKEKRLAREMLAIRCAMLTTTLLTGSLVRSLTRASSHHAASSRRTGYRLLPMIHVCVGRKSGTSCTSPPTTRADLTMIALSCQSASVRSLLKKVTDSRSPSVNVSEIHSSTVRHPTQMFSDFSPPSTD